MIIFFWYNLVWEEDKICGLDYDYRVVWGGVVGKGMVIEFGIEVRNSC